LARKDDTGIEFKVVRTISDGGDIMSKVL